MAKRFKKDDIISHQKKEYRCIVCDKETAAFCRFKRNACYSSTNFNKSFFVSNAIGDDGFQYEFLYNLNKQ